MRECRRVFSRRSLLWLLVLMAAVVFFHRVDHHNAPGFAAAYRQPVAQLAARPDPSAALSQMEAERRPLYLAAADAVIPNRGTVEDAVTAAMEALDEIFSH